MNTPTDTVKTRRRLPLQKVNRGTTYPFKRVREKDGVDTGKQKGTPISNS